MIENLRDYKNVVVVGNANDRVSSKLATLTDNLLQTSVEEVTSNTKNVVSLESITVNQIEYIESLGLAVFFFFSQRHLFSKVKYGYMRVNSIPKPYQIKRAKLTMPKSKVVLSIDCVNNFSVRLVLPQNEFVSFNDITERIPVHYFKNIRKAPFFKGKILYKKLLSLSQLTRFHLQSIDFKVVPFGRFFILFINVNQFIFPLILRKEVTINLIYFYQKIPPHGGIVQL